MKSHRVKPQRIPVSELKADPSKHTPKTLRWFQNEVPCDFTLGVQDEREDGTFILFASTSRPQLSVPKGQVGRIYIVGQSLDQATVDLIECPGDGPLVSACDFVIFQASPLARRSSRAPSP